MKKKYWLIGGGILLLSLIAWFYLANSQQVELVKVQEDDISRTLSETGYVEAVDDLEIQAHQNGRVAEILVDPGDKITKGQILIRMESPDLEVERTQSQAQLAQAEGELSIARQTLSTVQIDLENTAKNLARQETLLQAAAISAAEYEKSESAYRSLQKQLSEQQSYINSLEDRIAALTSMDATLAEKQAGLNVTSPIAGIILDLPVDSGAYVVPGTLLVQVGISDSLEVKADLLSDDLKDITVGQKAFITAPVLGDRILEGKVKEIRPRAFTKVSALGVEQRRVPVIISLNESANLKPAYEVQVSIEIERKEEVLTLPREAVRNTGNSSYEVMKVENGKVKLTDIKVGLKNEEQVEILSGLQKSDMVVRDAAMSIKENTRVKATE